MRKGQEIIPLSNFLLPLSVVVYSEQRLVPTPNIEGQGLSSYQSLDLPSTSTSPARLDLPGVKSCQHSWRRASWTITARCQAQGKNNFFQGQGKITGKNLIFETICWSRSVASFSAFHEVCVNFLEVRKKSGDSEIFLFKASGNLSRLFVNWLICFSICLFSSVGEFQRLVSESTGFIFYGPERFLGCMPPNMLAPMNITGDECVLTMSEWFHARWLDKTKLWSLGFRQWKCRNDGTIYYSPCLVRDSPNPDGPLVSIPYSLLYMLFAHPNLPIHTHFIWNFYEKTVHCFFTFYLVQVLCFTTCVCLVNWIILYWLYWKAKQTWNSLNATNFRSSLNVPSMWLCFQIVI